MPYYPQRQEKMFLICEDAELRPNEPATFLVGLVLHAKRKKPRAPFPAESPVVTAPGLCREVAGSVLCGALRRVRWQCWGCGG
ncbi:hypothetical protein HPB50_021852 [Hyalomma asiaticum]|uniref:Uncharacterized protein n=1 Tax=Hyalomma asiaticum TaxID=266040 RepID=A0ACB7TJX6_HYAAI|nr:hypothetical protein HPB50_021852 [Hyalomma asiaticum]